VRKPVELKEIDLGVLQELFDDIYGRWLGALLHNTAIDDLDQDISAGYVEAEVQAISDKVDVILAALRTAKIILE
jgi:hypothetical protein